MKRISVEDKRLIEEAIAKAELNTSGEIVPVILKQSDFYPAAHFRLAILASILASLLVYYFVDFSDPIVLIWSQLPGLFGGYLLGFIPFLKRLFVTKSEMIEEVHQRAVEIFHHHGVSATKDRTGIVIFVSLFEHQVEVLGDIGISERLEKEFWNDLVNEFLTKIKADELTSGLVAAIQTCGSALAKHFPIVPGDQNELSNKLITDV